MPLVQEKVYDGKRYVLITEGMKPTGGYSLDVEEEIQVPEDVENNDRNSKCFIKKGFRDSEAFLLLAGVCENRTHQGRDRRPRNGFT